MIKFSARAVAVMMRSAGSASGLPGRKADAISVRGGMGARRIPGSVSNASNQVWGSMLNVRRPFRTRVGTSQGEIGETRILPRIAALSIAWRASPEIRSPLAIQNAAQVSRRRAVIKSAPDPRSPDFSGRLGQIEIGGDFHSPLQPAKRRLAGVFDVGTHRRNRRGRAGLGPAEDERLSRHIDLLSSKSGCQPSFCDGAVTQIVRPPGTMPARRRRQFEAEYSLDFTERDPAFARR